MLEQLGYFCIGYMLAALVYKIIDKFCNKD